jgi:hypothetical protein
MPVDEQGLAGVAVPGVPQRIWWNAGRSLCSIPISWTFAGVRRSNSRESLSLRTCGLTHADHESPKRRKPDRKKPPHELRTCGPDWAAANRKLVAWPLLLPSSFRVFVVSAFRDRMAFILRRGLKQNESTRSRLADSAAWSMPGTEWFRAFAVSGFRDRSAGSRVSEPSASLPRVPMLATRA